MDDRLGKVSFASFRRQQLRTVVSRSLSVQCGMLSVCISVFEVFQYPINDL